MDNTSMREALEAARDLLLPQCNGGSAFAKACGETVNKIMDALKEERTSDGNAAKLREDLGSLECQVKPLSLDDAISHADEVAGDCSTSCKREHKQLADWLRELKNRRNGSGDAAKLREALKQVNELNDLWFDTFSFTYQDDATGIHDEIENVISAALAAPPRNCDVYDNESCRRAYHLHGDGLMTMQAFADWLFAPAAEKEGCDDGK